MTYYYVVLYKKTNLWISCSETISGASRLPFLSSMVLLSCTLTFLTRLSALRMTSVNMASGHWFLWVVSSSTNITSPVLISRSVRCNFWLSALQLLSHLQRLQILLRLSIPKGFSEALHLPPPFLRVYAIIIKFSRRGCSHTGLHGQNLIWC